MDLFRKPPPWAVDLYHRSARSKSMGLQAAFKRCLDASSRYSRPQVPCESDSEELVRGLQQGAYTVSTLERSVLFRAIQPSRLALPPEGFHPQEINDFLQWPFDELFKPAVVSSLRKSPRELAAAPPPEATVGLADDNRTAYPELVHTLRDRNACELYSPERCRREFGRVPTVFAGAFSLHKSDELDRFILNCQPGNALHHGMEGLQERYRDIISSDPDRARALGLSARVMDIVARDSIAKLPAGAVAKSQSDFSNYFYQFRTLRAFLEAQILPPIERAALGLPGKGVVYPVLVVMAMGHWASALLAHLAHHTMMGKLSSRSLRWRLPSFASTTFRQDLALLSAATDPDGMIPLDHVPLWG